MKRIILLLTLGTIAYTATFAQAKAVHFKKLQEFLPTMNIEGFERKKPTGQTQTQMGMTTSEAKVRYAEKGKEEAEMAEDAPPLRSIEITISDMAGIPYAGMVAMAYQQDFENESENGYEKSVTVKGHRGKESAQTGEYKDCHLEFMVANRYVIKLDAQATDDVKMLHKLAASIDLAKLEKLIP